MKKQKIIGSALLGLFALVCLPAKGYSQAASESQIARVDPSCELQTMDKELDKLKNQRNLYLAKATRLQNQGDRLQFEPNNLLDARRAWQQAQINREIATRIQKEIDILEKQREDLIKKHGLTDPRASEN